MRSIQAVTPDSAQSDRRRALSRVLNPSPSLRFKLIQLPKQTLDLEGLPFGQGEVILYAF
jgi:hypothetical protein